MAREFPLQSVFSQDYYASRVSIPCRLAATLMTLVSRKGQSKNLIGIYGKVRGEKQRILL